MKRIGVLSPTVILLSAFFIFFSSSAYAILPTQHIINFGGTYGHHYSPSTLTVEVGDTIVWKGDFSADNMVSTSVPTGAQPIGPLNSGFSFAYIVNEAGTYYCQNNVWAPLGMRDTINAVFRPHGSLTNEGREFYLGMLYPTYNKVASSSLIRQFAVYALVTTYYDNVINFSYYDPSGNELTSTKRTIAAHQSYQIPLNISAMRADSFPETPVYKACHIVSQYPVTVQYLSSGANSGGSYLGLPVLGLGKNYVVASYNDDAGGGALIGNNGLPANYDVAGGDFMIIASENSTGVIITPAATTSGGKVRGTPFSIGLNKGQCYFVRSDGTNTDHDISGTLIQASKPVAVISGHEDAFIGDNTGGPSTEGRDLMIEQMTPVEYWDTMGYIGIPFMQSTAPASGGLGDGYRVYTFDNSTANVHADVIGISGGYDLSTSQLSVGERFDITTPVDIYSTNGQKINVMQYDERSEPSKGQPISAPSMMTIVPHSRWRTSYNFTELNAGGKAVSANQYVGVISDNLNTIKFSTEGSADAFIGATGFSTISQYASVSNNFSSKGATYIVSSHAFYLHSDYPFICYTYGMNQLNLGSGMHNYPFNFEYAAPIGMQLNTGASPSFRVVVSNLENCGGWNICISDTSTGNPGVKAVMLVDDPNGVYFQRPGAKFNNVSLDSSSSDFSDGELHPSGGLNGSNSYCFTVNIDQKLHQAIAPIGIIDRNGNGLLVRLFRSAPTVALSTNPVNSAKPDSIFFPQQKVGTQICTTFVVKNTAPAGGSPLSFSSANLIKGDNAFSIQSVTPALPVQLKAQDSLLVQLCYTSKDVARHQDTLLISNDCFSIPVSLDAHSATGLISAEDITFGDIDTGLEICKTLMVRNIGSATFTLQSPKLSDSTNFAIDPALLAGLPIVIQPGGKVLVKVCFHPKLPLSDSAGITWLTDIDAAYSNSGKNFSTLTGNGLEVIPDAVKNKALTNSFSIRPNPAFGNMATVTYALPQKQKAVLTVYDVLGRPITGMNLWTGSGEFELPIGMLKHGLYYVRLVTDDIVLTQKLEVVR